MKANGSPEKIYLEKVYPDNGVLPNGLNYNQSPNDIEYIRKDAFIEKACSWLKENKNKYLYNTGEMDEYIPTCSGKMIEDFRAYMKGE